MTEHDDRLAALPACNLEARAYEQRAEAAAPACRQDRDGRQGKGGDGPPACDRRTSAQHDVSDEIRVVDGDQRGAGEAILTQPPHELAFIAAARCEAIDLVDG